MVDGESKIPAGRDSASQYDWPSDRVVAWTKMSLYLHMTAARLAELRAALRRVHFTIALHKSHVLIGQPAATNTTTLAG